MENPFGVLGVESIITGGGIILPLLGVVKSVTAGFSKLGGKVVINNGSAA